MKTQTRHERVNAALTKNGEIDGSMKPAASKRKGRREYTKHGLTTLKKAVKQLGSRAIDKRTTTGRELAKWRNDLIEDLGGLDNVSTQQLSLIDIIVPTRLVLDSATAWILSQPSLINLRKKTLLPVVIQRQALADALARYLAQLGLKRVIKTKTLEQILCEDQENEQSE